MKKFRFNVVRRGGLVFAFLLFAMCVSRAAMRAADANAVSDGKVKLEDLGEGLSYFHVTNLSAQMGDVRAALAKHEALVMDLRGVDASVADVRALRVALAHAGDKARVARFVLINGATAAAIPFTLEAGLAGGGVPGVAVIAPDAANVPADVQAPGSVEDDEAACEAIAKGASVTTLINHQPEKKRYDEAVLVRGHNGVPEPEEGADAENPDESKKGEQAKPITDAVLQVAVQTHRALVALRKL